jgi:hypothetical protein
LADKWKGRIKEALDLAGQSLDQATSLSAKIHAEVTRMLACHDKLVSENEQVIKVVMEDMDRFERVLDAAKVYKLRSEKTAFLARQWLNSDAVTPLLTALSEEMMNTGALVEVEKFKLAAQKMGIDFPSFWSCPSRAMSKPRPTSSPSFTKTLQYWKRLW